MSRERSRNSLSLSEAPGQLKWSEAEAVELLPQKKSSDLFEAQPVVQDAPVYWTQEKPKSRLHGFLLRYMSSWAAGLTRSTLTAGLALCANIALYSWVYRTFNTKAGSGALLRGSCRTVHAADTVIHLVLNVVSTCILGASNYCMQGLIAPTRKEVDLAHARKRWVHVGVQSIRNIQIVSWGRRIKWLLLAFTSVPFHLFQTNQYTVSLVSQSLFQNVSWQPTMENTDPKLFTFPEESQFLNLSRFERRDGSAIVNAIRDLQTDPENFERLSPSECIGNYTQSFLQEHGDVIVVTSEDDAGPLLWTRYPQRLLSADKKNTNPDLFQWVCFDVPASENWKPGIDQCTLRAAVEGTGNGANWTMHKYPIDHCMARKSSDVCQLQFNLYLMLGVVVFGVIKLIVMVVMVVEWRFDTEHYLRTMGDALASFLERTDSMTAGMCLVTARQLTASGWKSEFEPQVYHEKKQRWMHSMSKLRFWATHAGSFLFTSCIAIALGFAIHGARDTEFENGLGSPNIQSLTSIQADDPSSSGLVPTALAANLPQLGFTVVYLAYNNLFTRMLAADEWASFSAAPKGLRVSESPKGAQRSTYFLSLPFRWAIPLMTFSSGLHWLISQSLFLVRIDGIDANQMVDQDDRLTRLGYSVSGIIGIVVAMLVGTVIVILIGRFKRLAGWFGNGSNSVILSAACHPVTHNQALNTRPLMWGDITETEVGHDGVRHCGLTSAVARKPIEGASYRGR